MKTLVIIFNGIHLPYHVIDYAIEKATKESYEIYALFLRAKKEDRKGYLFPSDLETTHARAYDDEAMTEDEKIIADNMQLVKKMVETEKIPYRSSLKTNASLQDIQNDTATTDLIIIDKDFDKPTLLNDRHISLKQITNKLSVRVQVIPGQS